MLGTNTVKKKFERRHSIKDLFIPKRILNKFEHLHFESFKTFYNCYMDGLFYIDSIIEITIKNMEDFNLCIDVFDKTNICKNCFMILRVPYKEIAMSMIQVKNNHNYYILVDFETPLYYNSDKTVRLVRIDYYNYKEKIDKIIDEYNKFGLENFYLEFDYDSFDSMPKEEEEDLEFWIRHLASWRTPTPNQYGDVEIPKPLKLLNFKKFRKKIFISNDLKLYMDEKKKGWCFDLGKNLEKNGEELSSYELNPLGIYKNLPENMMVAEIKNDHWGFINFTNHKQINEIPRICQLITRWICYVI